MKILIVHNRYQQAGGEDAVAAAEKTLLESQGHECRLWTKDNRELTGWGGRWTAATQAVYSGAARAEAAAEIRQFRPAVMHVHNFFPLFSPAIYDAAREAGVPVVQTLHNYRLICPNGLFYRAGAPCEDCLPHTFPLPGVCHACYRNSHGASAAVAAMIALHRLRGTWQSRVDQYIALTEFARDKFLEFGLPAERLFVKPNFVFNPPPAGQGGGGFALFVGRLTSEKGVGTLLAAWRKIGDKLPLKICGDGPLPRLETPGVTWLGQQTRAEVTAWMSRAEFLVFPSEWYEGFPVTLVEALACGLPVVASRLGSMATIIEHGRTGRLFKAGDPTALVEEVEWLIQHPRELAAMRHAARAEFEAKYTAEQNYRLLLEVYRRAGVAIR